MSNPNLELIPHLVVKNAAGAIEFYKKALGFEEITRMLTPDGKVLHSALQRGDHKIFVCDEFPGMGAGQCMSPETLGGSSVTIHLGTPNIDTDFAKAITAGAKVAMPVTDMFWGDRYGKFTDPFGHQWSMSTHKEDVSPEEMQKRATAMFAKWKK